MKKIAIYGGSFNPPCPHHRFIAEKVAREFDEVFVIPCGPRPDKPTTNDIDLVHRAAMADMAFGNLPNVNIALFDLEHNVFTRTHRLEELFKSRGEVWHVVGTDLIVGGGKGQSFIQREWERGPEIWNEFNFAVVKKHGIEIPDHDLPPKRRVFTGSFRGSSSEIRERVFKRRPVEGVVDRRVGDYIERHGLYRGRPTYGRTNLVLNEVRSKLLVDSENPRAVELAAGISLHETSLDPNLIVVMGGDSFMLRAIRKHWRARLPFFGVNAGTYGFLLNPLKSESVRGLADGRLSVDVDQMPLLYTDITGISGAKREALAFNDVWIERASGQTAWIEVEINGVRRIERLMADGILAATSAGSTAYAKSMGATPVLDVNAGILTLVGNNVIQPAWKQIQIPLNSEVVWRNLDWEKRPLRCFVDGVDLGYILEVKIRKSRIAAAELAISPERAEKIMSSQFAN